MLAVLSTGLAAQGPGDANCDGVRDEADLYPLAVALFRDTPCAAAETNGDQRLTAADLVALVDLLLPPAHSGSPTETRTPTETITPTATATGTATDTPTITSTPTSTPTPTPTPTLQACAAATASLEITLDNRSGAEAFGATLSGILMEPTCSNPSGLLTYDVVTGARRLTVDGLAPGVWVHSIRVDQPGLGQLQHRRSLVLANAAGNRLAFTLFASVATVEAAGDGGEGNTLRAAILAANAAPKPALIQFDESTFPAGVAVTVRLTSALPPLAAQSVTLDGIDSGGLRGNRIIDADGRAITGLAITGASNHVIGMHIRNSGDNNRDVLSISGGARGNVVEQCIVETAATGDGIGIDAAAGGDFLQTANVVRDCEVFAASDKGIKVTTSSYARVERSWIHDNPNGGVQATLSGSVWARDNLIERNAGASAQNGLSVNGAAEQSPLLPSQLFAEGNIARLNSGNGLSLRAYSIGLITGNYFAGNARDGIRLATAGESAIAWIEGTTVACNATNGATVEAGAGGDFGGGVTGSQGDNAFTQNNLSDGFENLQNLAGARTTAVNNQWHHCGTAMACNDAEVAAYDLSDQGRLTAYLPTVAHRSGRAPVVTGVRPSRGVRGELIRIFGSGFNAIDGHDAERCMDLSVRNRCAPLRGNCVRVGDIPATLEAVTPTMLVIRLPFSCVEPLPLTVTTQGGGSSTAFPICTNAVP